MQVPDAYVGLDVHKDTIAIAVTDNRRGEQPRFWGNISNSSVSLKRLVTKLRDRYHSIEFVYEAGPFGYGIYRWLTKENTTCRVVAPSRIPGARETALRTITVIRLLWLVSREQENSWTSGFQAKFAKQCVISSGLAMLPIAIFESHVNESRVSC